MRSSIYRPSVPFLVCGAIVALLVMIAGGLLPGPAGFGPEPQSAEAALLSEVKKLIASDAQAGDQFGYRSVAISGDTAIVGAYGEGAGGGGAGAAYVFERDQGGAGNWGEVTKLTASDAQPRDSFGFSVAVSGDDAIVGAFDRNAGVPIGGVAYVFGELPGPVGGVAELPNVSAAPSSGPEASSGRTGAIAAAAIAGVLALSGAAWYARRRLIG